MPLGKTVSQVRGARFFSLRTVVNQRNKRALGSSVHASVGRLQNLGVDAAAKRALLRGVCSSAGLRNLGGGTSAALGGARFGRVLVCIVAAHL